jgi:hypothetical protein
MPQISRSENVKINKRTSNKELAKNNKQTQPHDTCATCHARDTCWTSNADNQLTLSQVATASWDDNNKDKNYHLHFDERLKAGCVVVVSLASLTIDSQVKSKGQKERDISFILGQQSLYFTDTIIMGLDSIDADLKRPDDVTNPFNFDN